MTVSELLFDAGVLASEPMVEFGDFQAVLRLGGISVLPWREQASTAAGLGVEVRQIDEVPAGHYSQAVVHLGKNRDAARAELASAWHALKPGGRLLLCGGNDVGIASFGKRLGEELAQSPAVLANRAHGRVLAFTRDGGAGPRSSADTQSPLYGEELAVKLGRPPQMRVAAGVFSAGRLDEGTRMLLSVLPEISAPRRVLDLGCGAGHLALGALLLWPESEAILADGDWRAVQCARANAAQLNVAERAAVHWWDAREPVPARDCDLALINPPFHVGTQKDYTPALAMFHGLRSALSASGRALVVANRRLPYESELEKIGTLRTIRQGEGFKVLEIRHD